MNKDIYSYAGSGLAITFAALQDNPIFQLISFILSTLAALVTIGFTIYKWYKKASEDGKITIEEIDDLQEQLNNKKEKK